MLGIVSEAVVRSIVSTVKSESQQFAVVVDGTQDCSGLEQESICIRYVDNTVTVGWFAVIFALRSNAAFWRT